MSEILLTSKYGLIGFDCVMLHSIFIFSVDTELLATRNVSKVKLN